MVDEQQGKGQSAELTAGTGFTFEDTVVAVYLSALLEENTAPALPSRIVIRVMTIHISHSKNLNFAMEEIVLELQLELYLMIQREG